MKKALQTPCAAMPGRPISPAEEIKDVCGRAVGNWREMNEPEKKAALEFVRSQHPRLAVAEFVGVVIEALRQEDIIASREGIKRLLSLRSFRPDVRQPKKKPPKKRRREALESAEPTVEQFSNWLKAEHKGLGAKWREMDMRKRCAVVSEIIKSGPENLRVFDMIQSVTIAFKIEHREISRYWTLSKMPDSVWQLVNVDLLTPENLTLFNRYADKLKSEQILLFIDELLKAPRNKALDEARFKAVFEVIFSEETKTNEMKETISNRLNPDLYYRAVPTGNGSKNDYLQGGQVRLKWIPFDIPGCEEFMNRQGKSIADGYAVFYEEGAPQRKFILHFNSVQPCKAKVYDDGLVAALESDEPLDEDERWANKIIAQRGT